MDPQIAFPNPIARTDLPTPRKKWRYVLGGLLFILILGTLLLPQIASSRIGRSALKMYLEGKYRGNVWIGDIKTSWFGATSINGFSLMDPEGRSIKFARLDCQTPFRKLLFGHYDLKNATLKDLSIDYVLDYGDGTDLIDRIQATWMPNQIAPTPAAGKPRAIMNLPEISGNITLVNATMTLTRGQILDKGYRTVFRSAKFYNINGKLNIESLDEPWTLDLAGNVGGEETGGTFTANGKLDLGEDGLLNVAKATADLTVAMRNVPNAATPGAGSLGWVLLSLVPAEDYSVMFGPMVKTLDLHLTVAEGKLRFDQFSAIGETVDKKQTSLSGHPTLDLVSVPRKLGVDGPTMAKIQLTREVGRRLAYAIPFLQDVDNGGDLVLQIDELNLPVIGSLRKMSGKGRLSAKNAKLISGQVYPSEGPRELTTQWQAVVGDMSSAVTLNANEVKFEINNGRARCEPYTITLNELPVWVAGETEVAGGKLNLQARVALPDAMQKEGIGQAVVVPITGTVEQPKMEFGSLVSASNTQRLVETINQHILELRARKKESLMQRSEAQVKSITDPFDQIIRATSQPATRPATLPVK